MNGGLAVCCVALLALAAPLFAVGHVQEATSPRSVRLGEGGARASFLPHSATDDALLGEPVPLARDGTDRYAVDNPFGSDLGTALVELDIGGSLPAGSLLEARVGEPGQGVWTPVASALADRVEAVRSAPWDGPGWLALHPDGSATPVAPPSWTAFVSDDPTESSVPATAAALAGLEVPRLDPRAPQAASLGSGLAGTGIKGDIQLAFLPAPGISALTIHAADLNQGDGADGWRLSLATLGGDVLETRDIPDDGETGRSRVAHRWSVPIGTDLQEGTWYVLTATPKSSFDSVLAGIRGAGRGALLNQVSLAGPDWGGPTRSPIVVDVDSPGGTLQASTSADQGLQTLTVVLPDGSSRSLVVDQRRVEANLTLGPGPHVIHVEKPYVRLTLKGAAFSLDGPPGPIRPVQFSEGPDGVRVHEALRGNPRLWTFGSTPWLNLTITKQDLNWRTGPDDLTVIVRDAMLKEVGRVKVADDGDESDASRRGPGDVASFSLPLNGPPQPYQLDFGGSADYLVRSIAVNQRYLVASSLFLVGDHPCCFKSPPGVDNSVRLLYGSAVAGGIRASTPHASGLQDVAVTPMDGDGAQTLALQAAGTARTTEPLAGFSFVDVPLQDVQLDGPGYFAFSSSSFFFPYLRERVVLAPGTAPPPYAHRTLDPGGLAPMADGRRTVTLEVPGDAAEHRLEVALRVRGVRGVPSAEPAPSLLSLVVTFEPKPLADQAWWR